MTVSPVRVKMIRRQLLMKSYLVVFGAAAVAALTFADVALAQSGHFVGDVTCTEVGTTVRCSGKVAGLGGETFTITVEAQGIASVTCTNPAGNVAPGQSFNFTTTGTTGAIPTPRPGQYVFSLPTIAPTAPAGSCPNPKWTAAVTDVSFTTATVTLREDSVVSDVVTVPVT
jgi:hypothetical protein